MANDDDGDNDDNDNNNNCDVEDKTLLTPLLTI